MLFRGDESGKLRVWNLSAEDIFIPTTLLFRILDLGKEYCTKVVDFVYKG